MSDLRLRQLFNRAVTDLSFRDKLFGDLYRVLLEHGIEESTARCIEARKPQTVQALAEALEQIDRQTF